jgi:hypothetical protein
MVDLSTGRMDDQESRTCSRRTELTRWGAAADGGLWAMDHGHQVGGGGRGGSAIGRSAERTSVAADERSGAAICYHGD